MTKQLLCPYALGALNYKNGFVTSCPQQSDQLHIYKDSHVIKPSEIINSEKFKQHRKELMSGQWSSGCHLCKEAEDIGARSMRQDYDQMPEIAFDLDKYNAETGEIEFSAVKHIELRFSNSCNFACLHCSDVYSSGWMSKLKNYKSDKEDKDNKLIQLTREFHKQSKDEDLSISISIEEMEKIVDDLNANFPNIIKIDFAGGEVLYQKQFFPCLERLAKHPNASRIALTFHSNFNAKFDPVRLSELLAPFGRGLIHMSLDAGTNIYEYFRTGDWDVLKNNVEKFRAVDKKCELNIVCTTSAYQIMDIENVFESFMTLDVDHINSAIVYTPRYMNPALMTMKFKDAVKQDIQRAYKIVEDEDAKRKANLDQYKHRRGFDSKNGEFKDIKSAFRALKDIEDYIFNHIPKESEWDAFMIFIRKSDIIWKHDFNNYMKKYKFINGQIERVYNV
jgi:MoaA/NifB/PqqE/SkfB family radical SAM enzyme